LKHKLRKRYGRATKKRLEKERAALTTYENAIEKRLVAHGVRPGEASVWMQNFGSFVREAFASKTSVDDAAERILRFHREESGIPWSGS
jgi:hypothetical protein